MKGLGKKGKSRPKPAMNVTPLVDVVLVLLIIFMVVLPAVNDAVQLELPNIYNVDAEEEDEAEPFILSIRANGELYFEEERLPPAGFESRLAAANAREPSRRIVLRGDREVAYERARSLFKTCQTIGFPGVSLRVTGNSDTPPPEMQAGRR
jgi:biopolymer transport protein TolR